MPLYTKLPRALIAENYASSIQILGNQSAPSKLYLLLLLAHDQDWAVGMPNN